MKKVPIAFFLVLFILLVFFLAGTTNTQYTLERSMTKYRKVVDGDLPDDISLTIYFLDAGIYTFSPINTLELVESYMGEKKIAVKYEELNVYLDLLRKMDVAILKPIDETEYLDILVYYVFETEKTGKLLEVCINSSRGSVFVNGIEVQESAVFYEVIEPFLTEEAYNALHYWGRSIWFERKNVTGDGGVS